MFAKLVWVTPDAEYVAAYITRGSNPPNQENPEYRRLFEYCLNRPDPKHWSPFMMVNLCVQFETSLDVAAQLKRHWSIACADVQTYDIQESSFRYMDPFEHGWGFQEVEVRKQGKKNRQSSEGPLDDPVAQKEAEIIVERALIYAQQAQERLKEMGVAHEVRRKLYPAATTTRFFFNGTCRSWIHLFEQRLHRDAQKETRQVAMQAYEIWKAHFPTLHDILQLDKDAGL